MQGIIPVSFGFHEKFNHRTPFALVIRPTVYYGLARIKAAAAYAVAVFAISVIFYPPVQPAKFFGNLHAFAKRVFQLLQ